MPQPLNPIVLSEQLNTWNKRTKFYRQLIALILMGLSSYELFPLWWKTGEVRYVVLGSLCLALSFIFGLLVLRTLAHSFPKPGRRLAFFVSLPTGLITYSHVSYPFPLEDPVFWVAMAAIGAGLMIVIDIILDPRYNTFVGFDTAEQM
jgi:hypothetical protein